MIATANPPPIPGETIDPAPKEAPDRVKEMDAKEGAVGVGVGVGYRAFTRFSQSVASLLAAGTAYYLFLAMFSILAFVYGLVTAIGADAVAEYVTEALTEAFPGLVGDDGIDPEQLRQVGQTTSIVGAIGLLYGGTGSVVASMKAVHRIYGAPPDSRNFVVARLRALGWLFALGLLILLSFTTATFTSNVSTQVLESLGIDWRPNVLLDIGVVVLTLALNALIIYLVLGNFGGIRPNRRSRLVGAGLGGVVASVVQSLLSVLISFTIDKPQYGALAAPIGILFVLYLFSMTLYGCAAVTAGVADKDVPLDVRGSAPSD